MKKLLCVFLTCALLVCTFGLVACGEENDESSVSLVAVEAGNVGLMSDIDYYVIAEPAASARVKVVEGLEFAGDLQKLYGGDKGYPQAVVVAKNSLIDTKRLKSFVNALSESGSWLSAEENSIETIAEAVQSHLTAGAEPSVKPQNLTRQVIKNCGVNFVSALDGKAEIIAFMEKFNSVSGNAFGTPSDNFFKNGDTGSKEYGERISVYAPDGAPALGLAKLMTENSLADFEYNVVNANTIQTFVGGNQPKADICVLPVNLAVKILGNGEKYKLIGTLTHGNLYILSKSGIKLNSDNLSELKGKTVGVVNLAAVPGLTFKLILKNYGIEYSEPYSD